MDKKIFFLIILISLLKIVFIYNNDFLYSKKIMKINSIENIETEIYTNTVGLQETHYFF